MRLYYGQIMSSPNYAHFIFILLLPYKIIYSVTKQMHYNSLYLAICDKVIL